MLSRMIALLQPLELLCHQMKCILRAPHMLMPGSLDVFSGAWGDRWLKCSLRD
jgi:hypothetical protein